MRTTRDGGNNLLLMLLDGNIGAGIAPLKISWQKPNTAEYNDGLQRLKPSAQIAGLSDRTSFHIGAAIPDLVSIFLGFIT
jgi:hypothetical protein